MTPQQSDAREELLAIPGLEVVTLDNTDPLNQPKEGDHLYTISTLANGAYQVNYGFEFLCTESRAWTRALNSPSSQPLTRQVVIAQLHGKGTRGDFQPAALGLLYNDPSRCAIAVRDLDVLRRADIPLKDLRFKAARSKEDALRAAKKAADQ